MKKFLIIPLALLGLCAAAPASAESTVTTRPAVVKKGEQLAQISIRVRPYYRDGYRYRDYRWDRRYYRDRYYYPRYYRRGYYYWW